LEGLGIRKIGNDPAVPHSIGSIGSNIVHMDLWMRYTVCDRSSSSSVGGCYRTSSKVNEVGVASVGREKERKFICVVHEEIDRELDGFSGAKGNERSF